MAPTFLHLAPEDLLLHRLDADFYEPNFVQHARHVAKKRAEKRLGMRTIGDLGRLFTGPFGSKLPAYLYRSKGTPLFRVQNVYPFFPDESNIVFLDDDTHHDLKASETLRGDVMIAKAGRVGDTSLVPSHYPVANITEHVITLRPKAEIDPYYLVAAFNAPFVSTQLQRFGLGTLLNYLGVVATRSVEVPVPEKNIRNAIGNKVRKAERLRELAGQRWAAANGLLSGGLKLPIEQSFFATFGQADAATAEYHCTTIDPPSAWALADEAIAAQYYHPRRIRTRKLAKGEGKSERLDELAKRLRKSADRGSGIGRVIGLDQIDSATGVISATGNPNAEHDGPQAVFEPQTILFSRLRPNLNKVTIWPESWATGGGSGELLAYRANENVNPFYLFFVLKSPLGLFQVLDVTAGSTLPRVESEVVDSILVPRLTTDTEMQIGTLVKDAHAAWYASADLIPQAKAEVESLIDGTLDEERLLDESAKIEAWLKKNPSPHEASCRKAPPEDGDT
jgi:type I restriction enzyme, S subunit